MFQRLVTVAGITVLASSTMFADFSYHETSTITGGMMASMMKVVGVFSKKAREPIRSTVAFKGDQMVHRTTDHVTIIDLGNQTITNIDLQKKNYSVMTFDQMKQMMDELSKKMKENPNNGEIEWKVSANSTGNAKQIAGYDAKEMLLKMLMEGTDKKTGEKGAMAITSHVWIAPGIAGSAEMRDFYKRMADKLNWTPGGSMFMARPDIAKGMAEAYKEMAKLDGTPVMQTMSMGAEGTAPAGSNGQAAAEPQQQAHQQQQQQPQEQPQVERPSLGGALGGALGGRFGLGRRKSKPKQEQEQPQQAGAATSENNNAQAGNPGSLLEMMVEYSDFSTAPVDASQFSVPAGFKKVDPDMKRMQ